MIFWSKGTSLSNEKGKKKIIKVQYSRKKSENYFTGIVAVRDMDNIVGRVSSVK